MKTFIILLSILFIAYCIFDVGRMRGESRQQAEAFKEHMEQLQNRCGCGETRSCAFGAGIVGIQRCSSFDHTWMRCEPNTLYCDDVCKSRLEQVAP